MAAKGVNLLPEDDDSQDRNEPEDDFDDDLDFEERIRSRPREPSDEGGGFFRIAGIIFAVVVLFASVSWAGYQFWWIPRVEKEQKKVEARKRLEQLRQNRLEQANAERERRKKELALLQKIRREAEEKVKEKSAQPAGGQAEAKEKPATGQEQAMQKKKVPEKSSVPNESPPKAVDKAQGKQAPEIQPKQEAMAKKPSQEQAMKKPSAKAEQSEKTEQKAEIVPKPPVQKKEVVSKTSSVQDKKKAPPKKEQPSGVMAKATKEKKSPVVESMKKAGKKELPLPKAMGGPAEPIKSSRFYTVQVATCRTKRCVNAFSQKLRQKGFQPFVIKRSSSRVARTEVLLDEFSVKDRAVSLAALARGKKLPVKVYQSGKRWRVSAGSFVNMEDAAQRLDQVEDAGLKAKLAARPQAPRSTFQLVGTGRLSSRKSAIVMRRRVVKAGFKDSFVVLRKSQQ